MQLCLSTFDQFAKRIKGRRIILFGAGVIGVNTTLELIRSYHLIDKIACYVDNDSSMWGHYVETESKKIEIMSPDVLNRFDENTVILINASRYAEILKQLDGMSCTKDMLCFIMPMMCIENFSAKQDSGCLKLTEKPVIPKKIHYIWFGKKEIPDTLKKCIESWRTFCPDYEIIRWDESNYDVHKIKYMSDTYKHKKYGLTPDYARLDILYTYGGFYMDTDVEMLKSIEPLRNQEAFCSVEKWQVVNFGGLSGAVKGHPSLLPFLEAWSKREFLMGDGSFDLRSSGYIDTGVAIKHGYSINGTNQWINGMNIYTYDYFHPYDYMSGKLQKTDHTYSIHHFHGGWLDENQTAANKITSEHYDCIYRRAKEEKEVIKL